MTTLRVSIGRVGYHAGAKGELMLQRLCGMHGALRHRGSDGKPWLTVGDLSAEQIEGITGLLRAWGVPATAIEVVAARRRIERAAA
jgi:hypothetical protein